jgi:hypothetical protein
VRDFVREIFLSVGFELSNTAIPRQRALFDGGFFAHAKKNR